jgi:acyl-CoA thioesterase-1
MRLPPVAVPHLRAAMKADEPLLIAALGSSSTQSLMASDPAHSYPAVLQTELSAFLPHRHVAVINRGIAGQDASEEVARLDSDVIALRPQAVVWQVGANGVLRGTQPSLFRRLVTAGIKRMQSAGIDVILMDNQRAPRILAAPAHLAIDQALADIAVDTGASLFARSALMDGWRNEGRPYDLFISSDGLHHNDLGYRCVATALAGSIAAGLGVSDNKVVAADQHGG